MAKATIRIDFPFEVVLEHPDIDLSGMFDASHVFDLFEVPDKEMGTRHPLTVDVMQVGRNETVLRVTPKNAMTYKQLADEIVPFIEEMSEDRFHGGLKAKRIVWHMTEYGISSERRRTFQRIN